MSTTSAAGAIVASTVEVDDDENAQHVVVVYNCSRIGLTANPPGFSWRDWLPFRRRRHGKSAR